MTRDRLLSSVQRPTDRRLPQPSPDAITIYLVRHGEVDADKTGKPRGWREDVDTQLNALGKRQGLTLAPVFRPIPLTDIITSDLNRAKDTGAFISGATGISNQPTKGFRPIDYGTIYKLPLKQIRQQLDMLREKWAVDPAYKTLGGESFATFRKRNLAAMQAVLTRAKVGDGIAIVAHARTSKLFKAVSANGGDFHIPVGFSQLDDSEQKNGDVSVFEFNPSTGKLLLVAENVLYS